MKRFITLAVFIAIGFVSFGQTTPKYVYCEIVGTTNMTHTKVTIKIDYGQARKVFADTRLNDEDGRVKKFNSMIDALNYMGKQGWEFEQAYAVAMGNVHVYHYLMKKTFTELDEGYKKAIMQDE